MVNICRHIILTFRNLNNLTNLRFKPWDIKASSRSWAELEVPVFQPLELISEYLHSCTAIKDVCQNLQGPQVVHSVLACSQENIFSVYQHFQDLYHSNSIVRTISLDSPSYPAPLFIHTYTDANYCHAILRRTERYEGNSPHIWKKVALKPCFHSEGYI